MTEAEYSLDVIFIDNWKHEFMYLNVSKFMYLNLNVTPAAFWMGAAAQWDIYRGTRDRTNQLIVISIPILSVCVTLFEVKTTHHFEKNWN